MNQIRLEVRLSIIAHVGSDIPESERPVRPADAADEITLLRIAQDSLLLPREHVSDTLRSMLYGIAPICGARITHQLIAAKRAADHNAASS